jgi:hypothetical protein
MASCGNTTCDQFDMHNAKWFKITQTGQKPGTQGEQWYQEDLSELFRSVAAAPLKPSRQCPEQLPMPRYPAASLLVNIF